MTNVETDMPTIARNIIGEVERELRLSSSELSQETRNYFEDAKYELGEVLSAARQAEADTAELRSKRDLVPVQGFQRLQHEIAEQARARSQQASDNLDRHLEGLKKSLIEDALPAIDPARESLARQELSVAIGEAQGGEARSRVISIVKSGGREATAVLLRDSFGRTLLEARGLTGRDLTETLDSARTIAAGIAAERGSTERERIAANVLQQLGKLGAARGAAGTALLHAVNDATK